MIYAENLHSNTILLHSIFDLFHFNLVFAYVEVCRPEC